MKYEAEPDAVLVVGGALDDALLMLLKARLIPGAGTDGLLRGSGPASSFSARIDLCYAVGLVQSAERKLLHNLRKIRNDCAHVGGAKFADSSLFDRCMALHLPYGHIPDERDPAMAAAGPLFEAAVLKLLPDQTAMLQHGARIIRKSS